MMTDIRFVVLPASIKVLKKYCTLLSLPDRDVLNKVITASGAVNADLLSCLQELTVRENIFSRDK